MRAPHATLIIILSAVTTSLAHFLLEYPIPRTYNEETINQFPCGGQNEVSTQRTLYPLKGGAIGLEIGHERTNIQVLIAFESEPTTNFNTVLRHTFTQEGLGKFCMTNINMPSELDIHEGQNATIQVITNDDSDTEGGLYSCADITFGISAFDFDVCQNSTGISVTAAKISGNANETNPGDPSSESSNSVRQNSVDLFQTTVILGVTIVVATGIFSL